MAIGQDLIEYGKRQASEALLALLDQHIPSITDEDEMDMDEKFAGSWNGIDWADYARRTCSCDKKIDGFYEYVDHVKEVLRG